MNEDRATRIGELLRQTLRADVEVIDQSHLHAGHPGAADGRGHFVVRVTSERFAGEPKIRRHRMVYAALGDMMDSDIHALSIEARTPEERATEQKRPGR